MNKIIKYIYITEHSIIPDVCAQIISGCQFYINTEWPKIMYTHFDMKNITL